MSGASEHSTTLTRVVQRGWCIGCGMCVALCPQQRLRIVRTPSGGLEAALASDPTECPARCHTCHSVCPHDPCAPNTSVLTHATYGRSMGARWTKELGYFQDTSVAFATSDAARLSAASGGVATAVLSQLLATGAVDAVGCVAKSGESNHAFQYALVQSEPGVTANSKSAYYPVHLADLVRAVRRNSWRIAVTCLPCQAKALRLACSSDQDLAKRVVCVVGLVCGHGCTTRFSEYAALLAGAPQGAVSDVRFRIKSRDRLASDSGTSVTWSTTSQRRDAMVLWSQGLGRAWAEWWFVPRACSYCDDVFAETADISLMDAWLPQYSDDALGTNLVIVRSELARRVLEAANAARILCVEPIPPELVARSQAGVLAQRRDALASRLDAAPTPGPQRPRRVPHQHPAGRLAPESARAAFTPLRNTARADEAWRRGACLEDVVAMLQMEPRLRVLSSSVARFAGTARKAARRIRDVAYRYE